LALASIVSLTTGRTIVPQYVGRNTQMDELSGIDWEDAFSNAAYIKDAMRYPPQWKEQAHSFRDRANCDLNITYGDHPREVFDLFWPETKPTGLIIFIHGGYWVDFDKSSWSHLAEGAISNGWAVAIPSYPLAPEMRIPQITQSVTRSIEAAAGLVSGPIRLTGHSAGGHLATRMVCSDTSLSAEVSKRIDKVVSISGVHDLRPLRAHGMNENLRLSPGEAIAESPALNSLLRSVDVTAWVGALERPEFLRQSALLIEAWTDLTYPCRLVVEEARHHFDVVDGLCDPNHRLTRILVDTDILTNT
jgi:arylformamidase